MDTFQQHLHLPVTKVDDSGGRLGRSRCPLYPLSLCQYWLPQKLLPGRQAGCKDWDGGWRTGRGNRAGVTSEAAVTARCTPAAASSAAGGPWERAAGGPAEQATVCPLPAPAHARTERMLARHKRLSPLRALPDECFRSRASAERMLGRLKGLTDPEAKRKAIGAEFIDVFSEYAHKLEAELGHKPRFLVQVRLWSRSPGRALWHGAGFREPLGWE